MRFANPRKTAEYAPVSTEPFPTRSRPTSALEAILVGPNGLRAGWRLLIFVALVFVMLGGFILVRNGGLQGARDAQKHLGQVTVTPLLMGGSEVMAFVLLCLATWIMGKIEHRKFSEFGLPLRQVLGKDFWIGALSGFLAISGTLLAMALLNGFRVTGLALRGTTILYSLIG